MGGLGRRLGKIVWGLERRRLGKIVWGLERSVGLGLKHWGNLEGF
jgi:hypothetical protein